MSDDDSSDTFDILAYSLRKFTDLTTLTLPWQPNITSLEKCSKLPCVEKLRHLTLMNIPAIIPPKDVAAFINKHMAEDGYMCLSFLIVTTETYYEKIKSLIYSKSLRLTIKHEPAETFILHP
uniref:Uncharacterized protein n=1 Tax=Panagrolaimus davidi TaxID=227884 RepID=A0A914PLM0_9BILA